MCVIAVSVAVTATTVDIGLSGLDDGAKGIRVAARGRRALDGFARGQTLLRPHISGRQGGGGGLRFWQLRG